MADQLAIYNVALAHLGERRLASLAEPREPARVLNDEWAAAVTGCLQMAAWSFATRTQQFNGTPGGAGPFPFSIPMPADWLRTADISANQALNQPLDGYLEEGGHWFTTPASIWVRYVSSDPNYGFAVARWHQPFADLVALALAARCCRRLTGAADMLGDLLKLRDAAGRDALTYEETTAARQYPARSGPTETRLQIYNDALSLLGRARTPSLTQATDAVRALNDQYLTALRWCLGRAAWSFACVQISLQPSGVPARTGYAHTFTKPADWVRTVNLSPDGGFQAPVERYVEEAASWSSDVPTLYVSYVSAADDAGGAPGLWTPGFCALLSARLAELLLSRIGSQVPADAITAHRTEAETAALSVEGDTAPRLFPVGGDTLRRLRAYNDALAHLGRNRVASLSDVSQTVRALNERWPTVVRWALQQAPWSFAARVQTLAPAGFSPQNTYAATFAKPADWIETLDVAADAQVTVPLAGYIEDQGYWSADEAAITVRYVSDDALYGNAIALWPPQFFDLVALRLAETSAVSLGAANGEQVAGLRATMQQAAVQTELITQSRVFLPASDADAVRLEVMNGALSHLGRPRLVSLTEARMDLRALNERYETSVRWCLEQGPWTWATRTAIAQPAGYAPVNGFNNTFIKPDDWLKTVALSASGDFVNNPLIHYQDADTLWYTSTQDLAVRYVSLSADWGFSPSRWTSSFRALLSARLAETVCQRLGGSATDLVAIVAQREQAMKSARANDALNTAPVFAPQGSWTRARRGASVWGDGFPDGGTLPPQPDGLGGASGRLGGATSDLAGADPGDPEITDDQGRPIRAPGS